MKRTLTIGILLASLALVADSKDKQQQTPAKDKKPATQSQSQKRARTETESKETKEKTSAPEMRPNDPLNPDPMRPGTPHTFQRTDPPKKDPTPPTTTKPLSFV